MIKFQGSFHPLPWSNKIDILSFLSNIDLQNYRCSCSNSSIIAEREIAARRFIKRNKCQVSKFLSIGRRKSSNSIGLISYPRSGNSLLRKLFESSTGYFTGSDTRPNRTLSLKLVEFGYFGEGIMDESVSIIKSHYPERSGYATFSVSKVILVVRNPIESIVSYFHMCFSNSHDKSLSQEVMHSREIQEIFDQFIANEAIIWRKFHEYWLQVCNESNVNRNNRIVFLRYEDLLNQDYAKRMIDTCLSAWRIPANPEIVRDKSSTLGYKPRSSKKASSPHGVITVSQCKRIVDLCGPVMRIFGYEVTEHASDWRLTVAPLSETVLWRNSPMNDEWNAGSLGADCSVSEDSIILNGDEGIRDVNDIYGRNVYLLRHKLTDNDATPLCIDV